jgi:uncharacterized protein (TIGR02145 family)
MKEKIILTPIMLLIILNLTAQISQRIHSSSDTISNLISDIDSIWFNPADHQMRVVLPGQDCSKLYNLPEISKVTFTGNFDASVSASCGAANIHKAGISYGSMTDQQGNTYKTILIGGREWMAENLRTSKYRNGDSIPQVQDVVVWQGISYGAWVYYDFKSLNNCPYGKLYNWHSVNDSRNLCPAGWHVPDDNEWKALEDSLGGSQLAGQKLKSTVLRYWQCPNAFADNSSGFSGLPGGGRIIFGGFYQAGFKGWWWTSTPLDANLAFYRELDYNQVSVYRNNDGTDKRHGLSVRCIKD